MPDAPSPMPASAEKSSPPGPPLSRFLSAFVLVPGGVILVAVLAFIVIRWATFPETTAVQLVETIATRQGNARWRAAAQLAAMLADPRHEPLRRDRRLAAQLAAVLHRELDASDGRQDATLCVFLCRALGQFQVDTPLAELAGAAGSGNDQVRRAAVESLAVLADRLGAEPVWSSPGVRTAILDASHAPAPMLRATAAFALGVVGSREAQDRLEAMIADENVLVRYNAATALARNGNARAVGVLLEMLAPDQAAALADAPDGAARIRQQETIHANALEAAAQLMAANPAVLIGTFDEALAELRQSHPSPAVLARIQRLNPRTGAQTHPAP